MKNRTPFTVSLFLLITIIALVGVLPAFADNSSPAEWTLAATPLSVTISGSESDASLASLADYLPQLILDRLNNSYLRQIASDETINRKLYSLRSERKKNFSDMKAAVLTRDTVLLKSNSQKEFDTAVAKEDKKIAELKQKITDNLLASKKVIEENTDNQTDKISSDDKSENEITKFFRKVFDKPVVTSETPVTEFVSLYKTNSSDLFKIDSKLSNISSDDFVYEKAVVDAGIEGLISGTITSISDYFFVTLDLTAFPGNQKICSISNVASFDDIQVLVDELSLELLPYIINSNPIRLSVNVTLKDELDEETQNQVKNLVPIIRVDDFVIFDKQASVSIRAGVHTVFVEATGFKSESITMSFSEHTAFNIDVTLQKTQPIDITFITPEKDGITGTVYLAAIPRGQTPVLVTVDEGNILGEYVTADGFTSFFLLPEVKSVASSTFQVKPNNVDTSDFIEKSRRRMYTSYGVFLLSLPIAFFSYGTYVNKNNIWIIGMGETADKEQWHTISNVSIGVSVGLGVNMLVQLGRYLYATKKVLPETVKPVKSTGIQGSGSSD